MFPGSTSKLSESVIVSSTTINPKTDFVRLTGATTIETIIPNFGGGFSGILFLTAVNGGITLGTSGNILVGGPMAQNRLHSLVYSKSQNKWYFHGL